MPTMDAPARFQHIALYGPFGWGNLGDAAIQEAMLHNVRRRLPHVQFLGISLNPDNTKAIHGIPAVPIARGWTHASDDPPRTPWQWIRALPHLAVELLRELRHAARCIAVLRGIDVLVISGGGQLSDDWGTPWDHPYSLLKWMTCARLAGTRVYVVSVGAGPIRKPLSGTLLHWALRAANYRSYRDTGSYVLLQKSGFTRLDPVYPDLAFSLPALGPAAAAPQAASSAGGRPLRVGISPMAYFYPKAGPWPEQDRARYDRYLQTMAAFAATTADAGHGVLVFLSQIRNDRYALDDLMHSLEGRLDQAAAGRIQAEATDGLGRLLAQIAHLDVVVTSRLHGVILSYLLHKPVIALSYDPKIQAVMAQFEQQAYCLDIEQANPAALGERLHALLADRPAIERHIAATANAHRALLDRQYDQLFGPVAAFPRPQDTAMAAATPAGRGA